jgi:hypothetical protein
LAVYKARKILSIPNPGEPQIRGDFSKSSGNFYQLLFAQSPRATRSLTVNQTSEALLLKTTAPVSYGPRRISKNLGDLVATHPLGYKKNSVQPMIVARLLRAADLILDGKNHILGISNGQWFHKNMIPQTQ